MRIHVASPRVMRFSRKDRERDEYDLLRALRDHAPNHEYSAEREGEERVTSETRNAIDQSEIIVALMNGDHGSRVLGEIAYAKGKDKRVFLVTTQRIVRGRPTCLAAAEDMVSGIIWHRQPPDGERRAIAFHGVAKREDAHPANDENATDLLIDFLARARSWQTKCALCGRMLREAESVRSGLGPCCAAKIGRAQARATENQGESRPKDEAEDFLRELLGAGAVPTYKGRRLAQQEGIARATLHRAAKRLGVRKIMKDAHEHWTMGSERGEEEKGCAIDRAVEVIQVILANGPVEATEVIERTKQEAGASERTIHRAKRLLGVKSRRLESSDPKSPWVWVRAK